MKRKKESSKRRNLESKKKIPSLVPFTQPFTTVVQAGKKEKQGAEVETENEWPKLEWKRYLKRMRRSTKDDLLEDPDVVNLILQEDYLQLWHRSSKTRERSKNIESLRKLLAVLTPDQRQLLNFRYCEGLTLLQLSLRLGVSYQAIQNRFVKIAKKIARHLDHSQKPTEQ